MKPKAATASSRHVAASGDSAEENPAEITVDLLARVKLGERDALDALLTRALPPLRRWAHGRLPGYARGGNDTCDLVQDAVSRAMVRLDRFEDRHQGALQAYLRQAVLNRIRDVIRAYRRRPEHLHVVEQLLGEETSALDRLIGAEQLELYDAALDRLRPLDREAIVARLELQYSYAEIAALLGKPSPDAARVAVTRALARLVDEMRAGRRRDDGH
jgi:RNA polymerase sigma factor (sigma-70 family)